jgi:hypothetical protein
MIVNHKTYAETGLLAQNVLFKPIDCVQKPGFPQLCVSPEQY